MSTKYDEMMDLHPAVITGMVPDDRWNAELVEQGGIDPDVKRDCWTLWELDDGEEHSCALSEVRILRMIESYFEDNLNGVAAFCYNRSLGRPPRAVVLVYQSQLAYREFLSERYSI